MDSFKQNVIVTGIPRGGTTLTAALIDSLTNSICLNEPKWQEKWLRETIKHDQLVERLINDFAMIRKKIINGEPVLDHRKKDGSPPTNYYSNAHQNKSKKRKKDKSIKQQPTVFNIDSKDFLLGIKHCTLYTGLLPQLIKSNEFSMIAITRHPVQTLLSWHSVGRYRRNKPQAVAAHWPELNKIIATKDDQLIKNAKIYDLFCQMYLNNRHHIRIIKYEDIIKGPSIFEKLFQRKFEEKVKINTKKRSPHYDYSLVDNIKESLYQHAPHTLELYSLDD
ncbi:hypothetical protein J2S00_001793 [Caldalkalibacillus uzonensis]|uniref:Sulfotransferase domain-containing protein n=1 Tax=Caldalkalibacillus uzonensis TaxID=353224 RepID=A0ABU0CRF8_9BACI|nr:sulfotransferase domain-containing protein [Caldalkalibacillus uzonensis]MDQ0339007.1 hypothetical protein [Caldalkalibacillus uzonensis]